MAARSVVCNDLLCFLLSKYGKVSNKVLTDTVVEAFEVAAIYEAKIKLLEDISALGSCDELPYISKDKSTSGQPTNDIDDMYALLILATDHDLIDKLPRYVTDKPDLLPGVHLTDGDMRIFVGWLKKMDDRLSGIESTLTAMTVTLDQLSETTTKVQSTVSVQGPPPVGLSTVEWPVLPARPVVNTTDITAGFSSDLPASVPASALVSNSFQGDRQSMQPGNRHQIQTYRATDDWGAAMSTPQTLAMARNSSGYDLDDNEGAEKFKTVQRRGRRRAHSSDEGAGTGEANDGNTTRTLQPKQNSRAPLVYGKAKLRETTAHVITAPKTFVRKSVFCVDNIDASFTADDVRNFVSKMSVRVVSCFEAKPRRRRRDDSTASTIVDRKAFRLCINSDDCETLLDDSRWPAHVTVSKWFFKQTNNSLSSTSNRPEMGEMNHNPNTTVAQSACSQPPPKLARQDPSNSMNFDAESDMDDTVIVQQSPSTDTLIPVTGQD